MRLLVLASAVAACTFAGPARAADTLSGDAMAVVYTIGLAGAAVLGSNTTFTVYDGVTTANDEHPSTGWAVAETAISGAFAVGLDVLAVVVEEQERDEHVARVLVEIAAMWSTALAVHGVWSLADDDTQPGGILGASALIGVDAPLVTLALSNGVQSRLSAPATGVVELVAPVPGIVVSGYEAATSPSYRGGWIALGAVSGALVLHGLASLVWGKAVEKRARNRRRSKAPLLDGVSLVALMPAGAGAPWTGVAIAGQL